jgi:cyclomaltodextrinase
MQKDSLSRRGFLRLSVIAVGSTVAVACQKALQEIATPTHPVTTSTASPAARVKMKLTGADAWTWVKPVKVRVTGECQSLMVTANGRDFPAQLEGDTFAAEVRLSAGENHVSATCLQSGGDEVRTEPVIFTERLRQVPTALIQIRLENGLILLDGSQSLPPETNGAAIVDSTWSARSTNPEPLKMENGDLTGEVLGSTIALLPPVTDGEYYLSLRVKDQAGQEDSSTTYFVVENGQPRIPDYDHENPAWVEKTVVYGVIPFLFGSPAFQAIGNRLHDLADLGINALWLAPINVHPVDDYGYAVEDYFGLDPAYGSEQDFHDLIQAAHERGIRVLMDFVPNHTSDTHPYFRETRQLGQDSNYWDFYDRDEQGNSTHYFTWTNLPNLNYDNPEVQRMMIEAFSYWVREFDVDGFRVDAAWAIQERRPDFWPEWRRALKRIKPDLLLLAEAGARDPYFFKNGFDAAYDWTAQVGGWAWKVVWDTYKLRLLAYNLTDALENRPDGFDPDALIFRFLNNNDTGKRFITRYGEGVTRVATALLLTLPGIPCIYTGDEYGLEFEPYQQLEPLTFEEKFPGLRDYHKKLIALRNALPSLHSRLWSPLKSDAVPQAIYSYLRYSDPSESPLIVLLNFSEESALFSFELPEEFGALANRGSLYDLLAEQAVQVSSAGKMKVSVPAMTARILAGEPPPS